MRGGRYGCSVDGAARRRSVRQMLSWSWMATSTQNLISSPRSDSVPVKSAAATARILRPRRSGPVLWAPLT